MNAEKLKRLRAAAMEQPRGLGGSAVLELFTHIDQQQADIDRLNRAYEVLECAMREIATYSKDTVPETLCRAVAKAFIAAMEERDNG